MNLNGEEYYYIRNAQGDIIGLYDKNGEEVVKYSYDSWGKVIAVDGTLKDSVGVKNPYRYRGYRYDSETGLYYLNSRYYNPEWGRFVNADALTGNTEELLSHNVFAYCSNNPIMRQDPNGYIWDTILDIGSAIDSLITCVKSPSWGNFGYLAWDVGSIFVPVAPGSYAGKTMKLVSKADDVGDSVKVVSKVAKGTSKAYAKEKVTRRTKQITEARRKISKANIEVEKVKFLGSDNIKVANGKWRSRDGRRQFRAKLNDINGRHGNIGPHIHFEFLDRTMEVLKNVHVPIR